MANKCFVLTPLKDPFNEYYRQILVPAIEAAGFQPIRADEIYGTRSIIDDIFKEIREAAVLVADVTGKNPNVNYELGVAHALERPAVIISQSIDDIPFDYRHLRAIMYDTTESDWGLKLNNKIINTLQKVERRKEQNDVAKKERLRNLWQIANPEKLVIVAASSAAIDTGEYIRLTTGIGQVQALALIVGSLNKTYENLSLVKSIVLLKSGKKNFKVTYTLFL